MKFNNTAFENRKAEQYGVVIKKITEEWEAGKPFVNLEVDTDVFSYVRSTLKAIDDIAMVSVGPKNALSRQKGDKTLFKVAPRSILS